MLVKEFSIRDPLTVPLETSVKKVSEMMSFHGFRHVPVMSDGKIIGIVSDRDVKSVENSENFEALRVEEIMTENPISVSGETPLSDAVSIFVDRQISSLLVTGGGFENFGIFTVTDALKALIKLLDYE